MLFPSVCPLQVLVLPWVCGGGLGRRGHSAPGPQAACRRRCCSRHGGGAVSECDWVNGVCQGAEGRAWR